MTPALRESLSRLLESWTRQIGSVIVEAGRLQTASDFLQILNNGPYLAADALELGLVDKLGYWDEAEKAMNRAYPDIPEEDYMDPVTYLWALDAEIESGPGTSIALVYGVGPILPDSGDSFFDDPGFQPYSVADALSDAREDDSIAAVVFRVDSPGGAYGPSDSVWREMVRLRESGKPVIVSMGGAAASGGYFVSMNADQVFALPGTLTGSIGVYSGKFATADLWDRFGIRWERLQAGTNAGIWSPVTEFSRSEREKFRQGVDFVYTDFTTKVAEARGFSETELDAAARGRVWTGEDARDVGLVDELGGLLDAIEAARIAAALARDEFSLRLLPEVPSAFDRFLEVLESGDPFGGVTALFTREIIGSVIGTENAERLQMLHAEGPSGILHMPPIRLAR